MMMKDIELDYDDENINRWKSDFWASLTRNSVSILIKVDENINKMLAKCMKYRLAAPAAS